MNILKPQKMLFDNLRTIEDLQNKSIINRIKQVLEFVCINSNMTLLILFFFCFLAVLFIITFLLRFKIDII